MGFNKPAILFIEKTAFMTGNTHIIANTTASHFTHSLLNLVYFVNFIELSSIFIIPGKI